MEKCSVTDMRDSKKLWNAQIERLEKVHRGDSGASGYVQRDKAICLWYKERLHNSSCEEGVTVDANYKKQRYRYGYIVY